MFRKPRRIVFLKNKHTCRRPGIVEDKRCRKRHEIRRHPLSLRLRRRLSDKHALRVKQFYRKRRLKIPSSSCGAGQYQRTRDGCSRHRTVDLDVGRRFRRSTGRRRCCRTRRNSCVFICLRSPRQIPDYDQAKNYDETKRSFHNVTRPATSRV